MLFALICRVRFAPAKVSVPEETGLAEWVKNAEGVARVLPEVFRSMLLSGAEKKRRMKELGVLPAPGETARDFPMLSIEHPEFAETAKTVARKLFCALYYLRTGNILSSRGVIIWFWTTNAYSLDEFLGTEALRPLLAQCSGPISSDKSIGGQSATTRKSNGKREKAI